MSDSEKTKWPEPTHVWVDDYPSADWFTRIARSGGQKDFMYHPHRNRRRRVLREELLDSVHSTAGGITPDASNISVLAAIRAEKEITERVISDLGTFGCAVTYTNEQGELTYVNPRVVFEDFLEELREDLWQDLCQDLWRDLTGGPRK
jgi:hypothetical protein